MERYYLVEDRCVMCGKLVPEGSMVCSICVKKINNGKESTKTKKISKSLKKKYRLDRNNFYVDK